METKTMKINDLWLAIQVPHTQPLTRIHVLVTGNIDSFGGKQTLDWLPFGTILKCFGTSRYIIVFGESSIADDVTLQYTSDVKIYFLMVEVPSKHFILK